VKQRLPKMSSEQIKGFSLSGRALLGRCDRGYIDKGKSRYRIVCETATNDAEAKGGQVER
jgi:hypothetical protein